MANETFIKEPIGLASASVVNNTTRVSALGIRNSIQGCLSSNGLCLGTIKTTPLDKSDEKILPDGIHVGLEATNRTAQKQFARIYVVSLLHIVVLSNGVEVTQPPLER